MSSITSVIALFVLLLATFSSSAPVGQEYGYSTPDYELTTSQSMDDRQKPINIRSVGDDQSTSSSLIQDDQSSQSNEVTTEYVTRPPRYVSRTHPTIRKRNFDEYSSTLKMNEERIYEDSTNPSSSERSEQYSTTSSVDSKPKRMFENSTSPSSSESSEQYSTTPFGQNKPKRVFEDSTNPSSSESSEQYSTTPFTQSKPKRLVQGSRNPSSSESSEQYSTTPFSQNKPKRLAQGSRNPSSSESSEQYSTTPFSQTKPKRMFEDSTNPSSSESSEQYSTTPFSQNKPKRVFEESTSPSSSESSEQYSTTPFSQTKPKRKFEESTSPSSSENSGEQNRETYSSPTSTDLSPKRGASETYPRLPNNKRPMDGFSYTTLESSTEFNQRAIRPAESEEEVESSTMVESKNQPKDDVESSSVHSFGKYTGLLADQQNTTPKYGKTEETVEEGTEAPAAQSGRFTKTVSIIPGKITETKIYANAPSKTSVIIQPADQEQLSQVQNQPVTEETKSDN